MPNLSTLFDFPALRAEQGDYQSSGINGITFRSDRSVTVSVSDTTVTDSLRGLTFTNVIIDEALPFQQLDLAEKIIYVTERFLNKKVRAKSWIEHDYIIVNAVTNNGKIEYTNPSGSIDCTYVDEWNWDNFYVIEKAKPYSANNGQEAWY